MALRPVSYQKVSLTDEVRTDGIRLIGVSNVREAISCISDGEQ